MFMHGELGFEPEQEKVVVALCYSPDFEQVGVRLFSTLEKAAKYKQCVENRFDATVKISSRFVDETKAQTAERCKRYW